MKIAVCLIVSIVLTHLVDIIAINYPIIVNIKRLQDKSIRRAITQSTTKPKMSSRILKKMELAKKMHLQRVKEITEHIQKHFESNVYLYSEMKKIEKRGVIIDKARRLLQVLEMVRGTAKATEIKNKIKQCYKDVQEPDEPDNLFFNVNNLVIHYLADPYNDNVYNK